MIRFSKLSIAAAAAAILAVSAGWGAQPSLAQGPRPFGRPSINAQAFNACTTTNYGDIAAKVLNITAAQLRKDLVSGQTLQDIATSANVPLQTVTDAVLAARKTDIDQAVTDGVMTQAEAAALLPPAGGQATAAAQGGGNGGGGRGGGNGGGGNGGGGRGGPGGGFAANSPTSAQLALC